jgi:tRNA1(Val) A37 N6-methylase TrmN6
MSSRDKILKEILSDEELKSKYNLSDKFIEKITCNPPYYEKKLFEIMATIINESDNSRTPRQIYSIIKNIHKI